MTLAQAIAQVEAPQLKSTGFYLTLVGLLAAGLVGWLAATVVGFARARFGPGARWFALASLCLLAYHVQWIALGLFGVNEPDPTRVLRFASFFNLFVFLASVCAVVGFLRLGGPRAPEDPR